MDFNNRNSEGYIVNGLKDYQIAELTNHVTHDLKILIKHQCLREMISQSVIRYLEDNNLRIDKK